MDLKYVCTYWILIVFRYLLDTSDLQIPIVDLGPLCIFWIPWSIMFLLDTLFLYVHLEYLGASSTFWTHWTFYILGYLGQILGLLEGLPTVALHYGEVHQGDQGGKLSASCKKWNAFSIHLAHPIGQGRVMVLMIMFVFLSVSMFVSAPPP